MIRLKLTTHYQFQGIKMLKDNITQENNEDAVLEGSQIILDGIYKGLVNQLLFNRFFSISIIILLIVMLFNMPLDLKKWENFSLSFTYVLIVNAITIYWWIISCDINKKISIIEKKFISTYVHTQRVIFFQALLTKLRHDKKKDKNSNILLQFEPLSWWIIAHLAIILKFLDFGQMLK